MNALFPRGQLGLAVAICVATLQSGPVATAHAGTYTVHSCRTPTGAAGDSGWAWEAREPSLASFPASGCPDRTMKLELAPETSHPANDYARINFWAPPDTTIRGYAVWRSVELGADYSYWRYEYTNRKWLTIGGCKGCGTTGSPSDPLSDGNRVSADGLSGVSGFSLLIACGNDDASTTSCPASNPAARLRLYRADTTLEDAFPPELASAPGGPLTSGTPLTGVQRATVSATDRGGGVYRVMAEVDDEVVSTAVLDANGGACQEPFVVVDPCKRSATGEIGVDTSGLTDGEHLLRLIVTDATGTNSTASRTMRITTANSSCNPAPAASSARLSASLRRAGRDGRPAGGKPARVITTAFGRPPYVVGQLLSAAGAPIASASVCVAAAPVVQGARLVRIGAVTTGADGTFVFRLPPGPSRVVHLVHRAGDGAVVAPVLARTRATVRLRPSRKALRNGQVLVLRGRLAHGPFPRRGVLVEFQAKRGSRWQTFGTRRTRSNGRISFPYRFTRTYGVRRYFLRARMPRQGGYPYTTAASRPVSVRVVG